MIPNSIYDIFTNGVTNRRSDQTDQTERQFWHEITFAVSEKNNEERDKTQDRADQSRPAQIEQLQ
jgi:hypothetical protein